MWLLTTRPYYLFNSFCHSHTSNVLLLGCVASLITVTDPRLTTLLLSICPRLSYPLQRDTGYRSSSVKHLPLRLNPWQRVDLWQNPVVLLSLHPFIDQSGLLRVGGRGQNAKMSLSVKHSVILPGKHPLTSLIITSEHNRLMHAGPTLLTALLSRRYHITSCRKIVCSISHKCVICRRCTIWPMSQLQGLLPAKHITPDTVFERVEYYAGPFLLKYGPTRKPTVIKAYVCITDCQGCASGIDFWSNYRCIHCWAPTIYCTPGKTTFNLEWSWH